MFTAKFLAPFADLSARREHTLDQSLEVNTHQGQQLDSPLHPASLDALFGSDNKESDKEYKGDSKPSAALSKLASNMHHFLGMHQVHYQSHNSQRAKANIGSLVHCGCNGGITSDDGCVLWLSNWKVNITGIEDHQMSDLSIGSYAGVTTTN